MTTERKIEIATAVMSHPRIGLNIYHKTLNFVPNSICNILTGIVDSNSEFEKMYRDLKHFLISIGGDPVCGCYWFDHSCEQKARAERIEFLEKYIEHLKQQENG